MPNLYLNKPQFNAELEKCLQCPSKPCMHACPVLCSPHDFIADAKNADWQKAAQHIHNQNPLGEICGLICPEKFCMKVCVRKNIDHAIRIPPVQAYIMKNARENNLINYGFDVTPNGKKVAVIGLGPSGIGAVTELLKHGFQVTAFEKENTVGGAINLIPQMRLPRELINYQWQKLCSSPLLEAKLNTECHDYSALLQQGFDAVIVTIGEQKISKLGILGEELAVNYTDYLKNPQNYPCTGHVAIVGGGAVAVDCATTAAKAGAHHVEMFVRRRVGDMRITMPERMSLFANNIDITTMTRVSKIEQQNNKLTAYTLKTQFNAEQKLIDVPNTEIARANIDLIILALGSTKSEEQIENADILYAGDFAHGGSTAVEAIASGKKAAVGICQRFGY